MTSFEKRGLLEALHPQAWLSRDALESDLKHSPRALLLRGWVLLDAALEGFVRNNDLLRAAALTYTVALSIVPILALAFSAVKAFGYSTRLTPLIERYVALGSREAAEQLMRYVGNVNAAALGSVGGAFLLVTVISTMSNVEQALNVIFGVSRNRGYLRRFAGYLSVLVTVPLLMAAGLAVTTMRSVHIERLPVVGTLAPYLFAWAGFFFLFVFFPYTKVRHSAAAFGSLITAILFQVAQWGYVYFQIGAAKYHAIYGALASVPIFLVWVYIAWSIVLFGAELTAAADRGPASLLMRRGAPLAARETALYTMMRLAEYQAHGGKPHSVESLARELGTDSESIEPIVKRFVEAGLVVEAGQEGPPGTRFIVLCRAADRIGLYRIVECVAPAESGSCPDPRIRKVLDLARDSERAVLSRMTLKDLLQAGENQTPGA
jgi:membrane protein